MRLQRIGFWGQSPDHARRKIASGKDILLPAGFTDAQLARLKPVRIVREHIAKVLYRPAQFAGIEQEHFHGFGSGLFSAEILNVILAGVSIDRCIHRSIYDGLQS